MNREEGATAKRSESIDGCEEVLERDKKRI
jgi:hypothetical protein